jgi:hypothetical protein
MSRQEPYTCARCPSPETPVRRCKRCSMRREAGRRELRARKAADGICVMCTAPAEKGYTRCRPCRLENNLLSSMSHAR